MNIERRSGGEGENPKSYLTNGVRKILLIPVTSNKDGDDRGDPALGHNYQKTGRHWGRSSIMTVDSLDLE